MCECGNAACPYPAGTVTHKSGHSVITNWIEVKHYEQMFYGDENYGYNLENDVVGRKQKEAEYGTINATGNMWTSKTTSKVINIGTHTMKVDGAHGFLKGEKLILSGDPTGTGAINYTNAEAIKEDFIKVKETVEIYGGVKFTGFKMSGDVDDARLIEADYEYENNGDIYIDGAIKLENTSSASIVSKTGSIYIKGFASSGAKDMDINSHGALYIDGGTFTSNEGLQIVGPANLMDIRNVAMSDIKPSSYGNRGSVTVDDKTKDFSYDNSIRDVVIKATRYSDIYTTHVPTYNISSLSITTSEDISSIIEMAAPEDASGDIDFKIYNFTVGVEGDTTNKAKGSGYDHIISTVDYEESNGVTVKNVINIEKSRVYNTEGFGGFVASRAAKVVMNDVIIKGNEFKDDVVFEVAKLKSISLSMTKVEIKDNTTHDSVLKLVTPIKDGGDYYALEPDIFNDVTIINNTMIKEGGPAFYQPQGGDRYAYEHYRYDEISPASYMKNIKMVGAVKIYDNMYKATSGAEGKQHNYYMEMEADTYNNIEFEHSGVYLASSSKIAVSINPTYDSAEWLLASQAWKNNIIQKGVTTAVWQADNTDWIIYRKTPESIMYGKKSDNAVVEVHYDYMGYEVAEDSKTPYHYVLDANMPDMPQDPMCVDGTLFEEWYLDKEMNNPLVQGGVRQTIVGVDMGMQYPVATLYAVYAKEILVVIDGNKAGTGYDGNPLNVTEPQRAVFKLRMGQKMSDSYRLKDSKIQSDWSDYFEGKTVVEITNIIKAAGKWSDADYWEEAPDDLHSDPD
ncbi:MAG: hypothetical protein MJ151_01925, partial [Lachnospiraceae bacterium]|nr:hypothetical protein [Lachnospiraceae bacterium]